MCLQQMETGWRANPLAWWHKGITQQYVKLCLVLSHTRYCYIYLNAFIISFNNFYCESRPLAFVFLVYFCHFPSEPKQGEKVRVLTQVIRWGTTLISAGHRINYYNILVSSSGDILPLYFCFSEVVHIWIMSNSCGSMVTSQRNGPFISLKLPNLWFLERQIGSWFQILLCWFQK